MQKISSHYATLERKNAILLFSVTISQTPPTRQNQKEPEEPNRFKKHYASPHSLTNRTINYYHITETQKQENEKSISSLNVGW